MRITKFGHACVRIEDGDTSLVIDPGAFTDPGATEGATAVLVTHMHADHLDPAQLRACDAPIWTIAEVADEIREKAPDLLERVTVVEPGAEFNAGFDVSVVGELHAVIHPEMRRFHNAGFLLIVGGKRIYHPGDALTLPGVEVDLGLVPASAPWLKSSEAVDFARDLGAPLNLAIHDAIYSEIGHKVLDGHMGVFLPPRQQEWIRVAPGTELDVLR
jgi:L-ascorbate metabolism protein UlaG (beta-lactamase superfamily)